jgi:hypothetical protein
MKKVRKSKIRIVKNKKARSRRSKVRNTISKNKVEKLPRKSNQKLKSSK